MGRTLRRRKQRRRNVALEGDMNLGSLFKYMHSLEWCNDKSLTVRHFPETGRGMCSKAKKTIVGNELVRLPIKCLITVATLEKDEAFSSCFDSQKFDKDRRITFQALLAFYILYQKHLGENSPMHAYISSLPQEFSVPYFCTVKELQCLPNALLERTVAQNRLIKDNYAGFCGVIHSHCCPCCGLNMLEDLFPLDAFKWAYFVVNSRCVYVSSQQLRLSTGTENQKSFFMSLLKDTTNLALAPFLDFFNHSDKVETTAELFPRSDDINHLEYVLTLHSAPSDYIRRFSQIFISYGALPNLKLFTEYGFLLHENIHDYFEFSLPDIERSLKEVPLLALHSFHRNKFKFIREHHLHDQMFVHSSDGISHNLRVVLHLLLKEPSYFPNILNQVAFGDATQLDDLKEEKNALIQFKIDEYKGLIGALQALPTLTASGTMAVSYLMESVRYLESCLD